MDPRNGTGLHGCSLIASAAPAAPAATEAGAAVAGRGPCVTARVLSEPGKAYAIYVRRVDCAPHPDSGSTSLVLDLPAGHWRAEWLNTTTGMADTVVEFDHAGGQRKLDSPRFTEDIALKIVR